MDGKDKEKKEFGPEEAKDIGDRIGVDWSKIELEQFQLGLAIELEHAGVEPSGEMAAEDIEAAGRIAKGHLEEFHDYYTREKHLEEEAEKFWEEGRG